MTPELREKLLAFGNGAEPFLQHNHFCVEDVDDGTSLVTLELQRENLNRWGAPHGGTLFAMADIAARDGRAHRAAGRERHHQRHDRLYGPPRRVRASSSPAAVCATRAGACATARRRSPTRRASSSPS